MTQAIKTAVVGGGPAGLAAAITAARLGQDVTIFEKTNKLGKTILKTGNGRCNFSNTNIDVNEYNNPQFVKEVLDQVDVYKFFDSLGLAVYVDNEGRMYPYTRKASTVVDVLLREINKLNIKVKLNSSLEGKFDKTIIATGGGTKNILGPLATNNEITKKFDGIRVHAKCTMNNISETGELLFRKYGVSGICIFNLSRYLDDVLHIDFFPEFSEEELQAYITKQPYIKPEEILAGIMLPKISKTLFKDKIDINKLKDFTLHVKGIADASQCQVCRGGVNYLHKGNTYYAGEAVNVDGPCGGYNLHWAWASGIYAAQQ